MAYSHCIRCSFLRATAGPGALLWLSWGLVACGPASAPPRRVSFQATVEYRSPDWRRRVQALEFFGERTDARTFMLLRLALHDPVSAVRVAAVEGLGRRQTRRALDPLMQATRDRDPRVRQTALRVLRVRVDPSVLAELLPRLGRVQASDRPALVRTLAHLLGRARPRPRAKAVQRLLLQVRRGTEPRASSALAVLHGAGPAAVPGMLQALITASDPARRAPWAQQLRSALLRHGKALLAPLLATLDGHPARSRPAQLAGALLARLGAAAVPRLVARLDIGRTGSFEKCRQAARILKRIGAPAVIPLVKTLQNPSPLERRRALNLLARIGHPRAAPGVIRLLRKSPRVAERRRCVSVLAKLGDRSAIQPVVVALGKDQPETTPLDLDLWAPYAKALAALRAAPSLVRKLLASTELQHRLVAAQVAGRLRTDAVVPALVKTLGDRWPEIAAAAARALGRLHAKAAGSRLRRLLTHRNVSVRVEAANALGLLGDPRAVYALQGALRRRSTAVRIAVIRALVRLHARTALATLRTLAATPHPVLLPLARWAVARLTGRSKASPPDLCTLLSRRLVRCAKPRRAAHPAPTDPDLVASLKLCARTPFTGVASCAGALTCDRCRACTLELGGLYNGQITRWWSLRTRKKREEGAYLRGKRHGRWRTWYRNGKKHTDGTYVLGRRIGMWTTWWPSGKKRESAYYLQDRLSGIRQRWDAHGRRREVSTWVNGRQSGITTTWHENRKPATRTAWLRGKRHGPALTWHENGKRHVLVYYYHGKRNGQWIRTDPKGTVRARGTYHMGKRHGLFIEYDAAGTPRRRVRYVHGRRQPARPTRRPGPRPAPR